MLTLRNRFCSLHELNGSGHGFTYMSVSESSFKSRNEEEPPKRARKRRLKVVKYGIEEIDRPKLLNGESVTIRHGRILADAIAAGILARADSSNGEITDEDVLPVFRQWPFRKKVYESTLSHMANVGCLVTRLVCFDLVVDNTF